jgi:hypothetical protein
LVGSIHSGVGQRGGIGLFQFGLFQIGCGVVVVVVKRGKLGNLGGCVSGSHSIGGKRLIGWLFLKSLNLSFFLIFF